MLFKQTYKFINIIYDSYGKILYIQRGQKVRLEVYYELHVKTPTVPSHWSYSMFSVICRATLEPFNTI